jgi:hypothetical protein
VTSVRPIPAIARAFTLADQREFAELSGDWNLLHVDPVAARRTLLGAPVVHGVHLVMWALEGALAGASGEVVVDRVRAAFRNPAYLDRELVARFDTDTIEVRDDGRVVLDLAFQMRDASHVRANRILQPPGSADALDRSFDDAASASGALVLMLDVERASRTFPACVARLGNLAVAELLATTRLVGMIAPGLHSLYAGLALTSQLPHAGGDAVLRYEVAKAIARYSSIALSVRGAVWSGTLDTFYRPPPAVVPLDEVVRLVAPSEYASQRALVIGGSRGLGEALVKALALGGADVAFTYRVGERDAARVAGELAATGHPVRSFEFDVLAPGVLAQRWGASAPPTHLYYVANPAPRSERELAMRVLATSLDDVVAETIALGAAAIPLVVWVPSTAVLDGPGGPADLRAAKLAVEAACAELPARFPVTVHVPRLPKFATDQSAALIRVPLPSPIAIAVDELRRLASG